MILKLLYLFLGLFILTIPVITGVTALKDWKLRNGNPVAKYAALLLAALTVYLLGEIAFLQLAVPMKIAAGWKWFWIANHVILGLAAWAKFLNLIGIFRNGHTKH